MTSLCCNLIKKKNLAMLHLSVYPLEKLTGILWETKEVDVD